MKLYDNVVTLRVRVKCPSESKKDSVLSDKLSSETGADHTWLRVRKDLFKLRDITRHRDRARKILRDRCVPWSATRTDNFGNKKEDALWAASGRDIADISEQLQECREAFFDAVKDKVRNYENLLDEAKQRLGSAFNPTDFPTKQEFEARFDWQVEVDSLQNIADMANDFRTKLPAKMAEEQIKLAESKLKSQMANGVQNVMDRTLARIMGDEECPGIVPRLRAYDPDLLDKRKGNTFRDKSIYENLDDFQEWAESINEFLDSPEIQVMVDRVNDFRTNVRPENPEEIRTDDAVRNKVISGLMDIVDSARTENDSGFGQFM